MAFQFAELLKLNLGIVTSIAGACAIELVVAVAAALTPSLRASQADPVEALRAM